MMRLEDKMSIPKAIILLSGGLDSATCMAIAKEKGFECYGLSFNYDQRLSSEIEAAKKICMHQNSKEHRIVSIGIGQFGGSALTDNNIEVPTDPTEGIPITYVPARNTVFLSMALGWAEVLGARDIFIGANSVDYSGYPDCRAEFLESFERTANLGTKAGVSGDHFHIHAPLLNLTKAQIIQEGIRLGVDYGMTISCYSASEEGLACGRCDSCRFRAKGFENAGVPDPTPYQELQSA